ncbi:MAG: WbqC family protein [bacterium]|nr:WbqC family protein [bacterium]
MIVACHQPNYIPWYGYFYKMRVSDIFVFLDSVQFPRGTSWVNRNRIKSPSGQLWLTVPVKKKGLGLQKIRDVKIDNTHNWKRSHILSMIHFYSNAPYFDNYIDFFKHIYEKNWVNLLDLNLEMIKKLTNWLEIGTKVICSSELGVAAKGTELLIEICKTLSADTYLSGSVGKKYLDYEKFKKAGINLKYYNFNPPPYPQLWGEFISNLSVVDLLFTCGKKGFDTLCKSAKFVP